MNKQDFCCSICKNICDNFAIECSICSNWMHHDCVPHLKDQLEEWSADDAVFTCRSCAFQRRNGHDVFDFKTFLDRLEVAAGTKDLLFQQHLAKWMMITMKTHQVTLPPVVENYDGLIDKVSVDILHQYNPIILQTHRPIRIYGDGNCLYRAVSKVLYNSETHHLQLRFEAALEILLHQHLYDSTFPTYRDQVQSVYVVCSDYQDLINSTVTRGAYSELLHMYALSAVSGFSFRSYYPPANPFGNLSNAFTRRIIGRNTSHMYGDPPIIMWTQCILPPRGRSFTPNHFVPLKKITTPSVTSIINISDDEEYDDGGNDGDDREEKTELKTETVENLAECISTDFLEEECMEQQEHQENSDAEDDTQDEVDACTVAPLCTIDGPAMGYLPQGKFMDMVGILGYLSETEDVLKEIPPGIKNNVFFVLDNSENKERRLRGEASQFWDDCGVWVKSSGGSPKMYFIIAEGKPKSITLKNGQFCTESQKNKKRVYTPLTPQPGEEEILVLQRYYCVSKESPNYKRRVTWIQQIPLLYNKKITELAIVEYVGQFEGRPMHGNAKKTDRPYRRTKPPVLKKIEQLSKAMGPRNVYDRLHHLNDDPTLLPASMQQVQNKRKQVLKQNRKESGQLPSRGNFADNVLSIIQAVDEHPFIQHVSLSASKVPSVVCYMDEQLQDIKRFCVGHDKEIWGFDKTFNLGDVFVTTSVFKHKAVKDRQTHNHPLFLGPVFLHGNSDFETYNEFFSVLAAKFTDNDIGKLTLGTDDEMALRKAIRRQFPSSLSMVCTRHLKNNVKDYLTNKIGVSPEQRRGVMDTIFGQNGITSSEDPDVLRHRVDLAINQWTNTLPTFVNYFRTRLLPILHENVCIPKNVREMPDLWTNNNTESINHVLKVKTNWKQLKLVDLIQVIYEHISARYKDLKRALYDEGSFYLIQEFRTHCISPDAWFCKTEEERTASFRKFMNQKGKLPSNQSVSTDSSIRVQIRPNRSKKPNQASRSKSEKTATRKL